MHVLDRIYVRYDEAVWAVLRDEPKFKCVAISGGKPMYDKNVDEPFSAEELAERLDRLQWTVDGSLRRLEKRGKIRELSGGWVRKEK